MAQKVSPGEVRRALAAHLQEPFAAAGFARVKTTHLGWQRGTAGEYLCAFLPLAKYGWDEAVGSYFNLQFQVGPELHPFSTTLRRFSWFNALMGDAELRLVLAANNTVARSLPDPYVEDPSLDMYSPEGLNNNIGKVDLVRWSHRVRSTPYRDIEAVELLYYRHQDVEMWGEFFRPRVRSLLAEFERRCACE
jgi:hypothetical protein